MFYIVTGINGLNYLILICFEPKFFCHICNYNDQVCNCWFKFIFKILQQLPCSYCWRQDSSSDNILSWGYIWQDWVSTYFRFCSFFNKWGISRTTGNLWSALVTVGCLWLWFNPYIIYSLYFLLFAAYTVWIIF